MRTLNEIINGLPEERRARITSRTQKLIAEEMALRHLRQARNLTQQSMATLLQIDQAGVSKIESRSDMLLSTLRSYVEAMGGSLRLVAEFDDGVVELSTIGEALDPVPSAQNKVKARSPRRPKLVHASD
jgi:transcriptional regulator with XRE-family HTH domain